MSVLYRKLYLYGIINRDIPNKQRYFSCYNQLNSDHYTLVGSQNNSQLFTIYAYHVTLYRELESVFSLNRTILSVVD